MNEKKLSLNDLGVDLPKAPEVVNENGTVKPKIITPSLVGGIAEEASEIKDIAAFEERVSPEKNFENSMLDKIDTNLERTKADLMENVIQPLHDELINKRIAEESEATTDIEKDPLSGMIEVDIPGIQLAAPVKMEANAEKEIKDLIDTEPVLEQESFNIDDEDLRDLMGEDDTPLTEEEKDKQKKEEKEYADGIFDKYQTQIKEVIKPISKESNLKEFRISTKPISLTHALKKAQKGTRLAQWALYNTKRVVTMSALDGEEIVKLNPETYESRFAHLRAAYSILYRHDVSANKPSTLEAWLRSICAFDTDELYFAAYKASYGDSNYLTYSCPEPDCKDLDLREVALDAMIKYNSDEVKERFQQLLTSGNDAYPSVLEATIKQVSNEYAIAFSAPSIYGLYFETSALDDKFTKQYSDLLNILAYIDNIYYIDAETGTLIPIDYGAVPGNVTSTVKKKTIAYYNIIKKLTSDQYAIIGSEINKISQRLRKNNIEYQMPEADCGAITKKKEKCNHHFKAEPQSPLELIFERAQLFHIANFSNDVE